MKYINILLANALIISFYGCNDKDNMEVFGPIIPEVFIEYVDKEGNSILEKSELVQLYEKGERLNVLSVTDDKGVSFMNNEGFGIDLSIGLHTDIFEKFYLETPKMDRQYIIKYKVPRSLGESIEVGESVEELKLTFCVDGIHSEFTNAWYNGKELRLVPPELIDPDLYNPQVDPDEEAIERRKKELLYSGDTVAYVEGFVIYLILPTEREK
ncbi:MAG: hypothetical protein LBG96_08075 [Tannerella sp.]|jgi:hypothetical protein|nr:hypothetical protein [Tannerella sp.]